MITLSRKIEIWVPVKDYEHIYQFSSLGGFRSLDRKEVNSEGDERIIKGKLFKRKPFGYKYIRIYLCNHGIQEPAFLHKLVAQEFVPNPEDKPCVNHIDGNKRNNAWWNLEWNTYAENNKHAKRLNLNKLHGETHHWAKLSMEQALQIRDSSKSATELKGIYNVSDTTIRDIKSRKTWIYL